METVGLVSAAQPLFHPHGFFNQYSDIIYRKAHTELGVRSTSYKLLMSHRYDKASSRVVGFYKGARGSNSVSYIDHLRKSAKEIIHPMLLPLIILSNRVGPKQEGRQREARAKLRLIDVALLEHMRSSGPVSMSLKEINANLLACHSRVWKNPKASRKIVDRVEFILKRISCGLYFTGEEVLVRQINQQYLDRVTFIRERLSGIENYCHSTLSRIDMQRTALHNILLNQQIETTLKIKQRQTLEDERKFSVNQTWNKNQRTISLLGIFFLPGAFIAVSISMMVSFIPYIT
jgi:hypothetical protein